MAQAVQLTRDVLRQKIIDYVKGAYASGETPSLGKIMRELGVSTRKVYELFPGGLREIYERAGVPAEKAAERLATTRRALEARLGRAEAKPLSEGEVAAEVFRLLEEGKTLPWVVVEVKQPPEVVKKLYDQWLKMKSVDVNRPVVLKQIAEFERRLNANLKLFVEMRELQENIERRLKSVEDALAWIGRSVSRRQREDDSGCVHLDKDGYCTYWRWDEPIQGWSMKRDFTWKDEKLKQIFYLNAKVHKFICAACPTYKPKGSRP